MNLKTIVPAVLLLVATISMKAQNQDYVISSQNDTIPCIILHSSFFGTYKYKTAANANPVKLKPQNIKEFYTADKRIWIRALYMKDYRVPMYMSVIERGKISLYEMVSNTSYYNGTMSTYSSNTQWYISKGSDSVKLLKNSEFTIFSGRKKRKNEFSGLIEDNKNVYNKYLADNNFSFGEIRNLVHLYNTGEAFKE